MPYGQKMYVGSFDSIDIIALRAKKNANTRHNLPVGNAIDIDAYGQKRMQIQGIIYLLEMLLTLLPTDKKNANTRHNLPVGNAIDIDAYGQKECKYKA